MCGGTTVIGKRIMLRCDVLETARSLLLTLNEGADKERGGDRVLITLVLRHLASNHHHVDPTSGSRCANKLTDQASYDPRRVFRFALPDIHVGPKTRSIGTYLSGGLVSIRPACHRSEPPCTLLSSSQVQTINSAV